VVSNTVEHVPVWVEELDAAWSREEVLDTSAIQAHKGKILSEDLCPKCGLPGFSSTRWVTNGKTEEHYFYEYFGHGSGKNRTWCYIGRRIATQVSNTKEEAAEREAMKE
jgi:hypothetical protein